VSIVVIVILLIVLIPVLWVGWAIFYVLVIQPYRKRTSYLVDYFGGREPGDGISVEYYEKGKELHFFSDRDEMTFYLPDEELWDRTMPDFFKGKRQIIQERLRREVPRKVAIKASSEYSGDRSILYVDNSKVGQEKVLKIGQAA
jgi:hypothetical protein